MSQVFFFLYASHFLVSALFRENIAQTAVQRTCEVTLDIDQDIDPDTNTITLLTVMNSLLKEAKE